MNSKIEKIRDAMFGRPDPLIFRSTAFVVTIAVTVTDKIVGGTWWAILAAVSLVAGANLLLPVKRPRDKIRRAVLAGLNRIDASPFSWGLVGGATLVAGVVVLDRYYLGGVKLGAEFNIYLIPVFFASLLIGLRVAVVTWFLSFLAVYYWVVPPRNSFAIDSVKDFAELIGFFYLGLITIVIPILIRASCAVEDSANVEKRTPWTLL